MGSSSSLIGITQRVDNILNYREKRDALDQRWTLFLREAGFTPLILPNHVESVRDLTENILFGGFLLTGGNDLVECGGDAPERDRVDQFLIERAIQNKIPLLGVCRGMQSILHFFHAPLERVEGHVTARQEIEFCNQLVLVNSYHNFGARALGTASNVLDVLGTSSDGVLKSIQHKSLPILGLMWHPERENPFHEKDLKLFQKYFHPETGGNV